MREIKTAIDQEFDDEDDDLVGVSESGTSEDVSSLEPKEPTKAIDAKKADEEAFFVNPLRKRAVELLLRPRLSDQKVAELLGGYKQQAQEKAAEVPDLINNSEKSVNTELGALEDGAGVEPIKTELADAKNEFLGEVSDAQDEFDKVAKEAADYVAKNNLEEKHVRPEVLDLDKLAAEEVNEYIPSVVLNLDQAEENKPAPKESEQGKSEAYKLFEELHGLDEINELGEDKEQPIASPEIMPIDPEMPDLDLGGADTSVELESPADGTKVEMSLRSQKNVGIFNRLGLEAKRIYTDLTFRSQGKREINRGQKMLEKSEDKAYALNKDLAKSDDKIEELKDKLTNIDEMLGKFGEGLKIKEKQAIYKSRQDLDKKIVAEEKTKASLALKLETEEANKVKLQEGMESAMERLNQAIDKRIEPYKQEMAKLETNRGSLMEEKENFEAIVGDFENRLAGLKDQMANLDEVNLPVKAKKSFQAVLNRKIKDIESALKISQKNISKLEDNIVRINGRLNKEDARLGKWEGIRGDLQETAQKKAEKAREEISRGFVPKERMESTEEIEEVREFSAGDYIDKWNSISKNDGMLLDKKLIIASKGELTLKKLEGVIKTTRFRGLSERQLKKKIKEKTDLLRAHFGIH